MRACYLVASGCATKSSRLASCSSLTSCSTYFKAARSGPYRQHTAESLVQPSSSRIDLDYPDMDLDDLVIIESEPPSNRGVLHAAPSELKIKKQDVDSDGESQPDTHPIIHTNVYMRDGRYRHHNYLHDTNDNCSHCHDFLLQAYREKRFGGFPPPSPIIAALVSYSKVPERCSLIYCTVSPSSSPSSSSATAVNALYLVRRSHP